MKILGISAFYHDSAATLTVDGKIMAAAQEERFTRKKHDSGFPVEACKYCLNFAGLDINDLDAIVFYDKPLLKFERLLESYYGFAPKGLRSFMMAMIVWLKEKVFIKKLILESLEKVGSYDKKKVNFLFPEHHLSHAASAFFPSPYEEAAILTLDGVGEWATASIGHGKGNKIEILKELRFPHSIGLLYSAFTYYLGFRVNSGEYKLMGLAPYGVPDSEQTKNYIQKIKTELIDIKDDGSIWLNQSYFNYAVGLTMAKDKMWEELFGFKRRLAESDLEQHHCNLGYAIQKVTEEIVEKMAMEAKRLTGAEYLCMAGGVALNCVANGKLLNKNIFKDIFIQPAAGDAGGSLGASLATHFIHYGNDRTSNSKKDEMNGSYLGPEFSNLEIEKTNRRYDADCVYFESFEKLSMKVADLIHKGNVIGWHQGRMEFGPRALGNRSILGDPTNVEMQKKINLKIKYRESFRPFAPSVLAEDSSVYFDLKHRSDYMLLVAEINNNQKHSVPDNYWQFGMRDRLYTVRSDIQAITHVDFTGRVQTVAEDKNYKYWRLINDFKKLSGVGMLINTSFNVRGEPIVSTPEDAYRCFMRTEMDYLVVSNYLYKKTNQPKWDKVDDWKEEFKLD